MMTKQVQFSEGDELISIHLVEPIPWKYRSDVYYTTSKLRVIKQQDYAMMEHARRCSPDKMDLDEQFCWRGLEALQDNTSKRVKARMHVRNVLDEIKRDPQSYNDETLAVLASDLSYNDRERALDMALRDADVVRNAAEEKHKKRKRNSITKCLEKLKRAMNPKKGKVAGVQR